MVLSSEEFLLEVKSTFPKAEKLHNALRSKSYLQVVHYLDLEVNMLRKQLDSAFGRNQQAEVVDLQDKIRQAQRHISQFLEMQNCFITKSQAHVRSARI